MAYIIDGHNLIPKISGLSLKSLDDEMALIEKLQDFCRTERRNVEVYFDRAASGMSETQRYGLVTAHFVARGMIADTAIVNRVRRLGGEARNWTVVSSDHQVKNEARALGARVISSEQFSKQLQAALASGEGKSNRDSALNASEIQEWLDLFGASDEEEDDFNY